MLSTEKITGAFDAICEEAEKLKNGPTETQLEEGLARIISIARHQNDIRSATKGSCKASQ